MEVKKITEFELIREWAQERGLYDKGDVKTQFIKLSEEFGETGKAILNANEDELKDGIGDMIVVIINLAYLAGTSAEECLSIAYEEIKNRKGKMINGTFVKESQRVKVNNSHEYFECIGLNEINVFSWRRWYKIGNAYKKDFASYIDDYSETMLLLYNEKSSFYVDISQFKPITKEEYESRINK